MILLIDNSNNSDSCNDCDNISNDNNKNVNNNYYNNNYDNSSFDIRFVEN
jgi:hypothetical protein